MAIPYDSWPGSQFAGGTDAIDFDTDLVKMALLSASYTPSLAHNYFDDLTNEVTGTNYSAGGLAISSVVVDAGKIDFADLIWAQHASGFITARYGVLYKDTTVSTTSPLVAYIDFGSDKGNTINAFTIFLTSAGFITY